MARCLPSLPLISGALAKGEISYSKVRALTRIADAGNEAELLAFARHGTTAHVERLVREWRRLDQDDACQAARAERRGLSLWLTDDGSYEIRGRLNPEVGSLLLKVLEVAEARLYRAERAAGTEDRTTAAQRRADALGLWLEERVQPRVQLVVHSLEGDEAPVSLVTAPLVTEEGSCVSAETSSRLACDAEVVHIARAGDGSVLDVGRRQRSVGWRLRKALEARDGGCRFPGCGSRLGTHARRGKGSVSTGAGQWPASGASLPPGKEGGALVCHRLQPPNMYIHSVHYVQSRVYIFSDDRSGLGLSTRPGWRFSTRPWPLSNAPVRAAPSATPRHTEPPSPTSPGRSCCRR